MTPDEPEFVLGEARAQRLGFGEAVFCAGKSPEQIAAILDAARNPMLLTRLDPERFAALPRSQREALDYDPVSRTAYSGDPVPSAGPAEVAVLTAGTSDVPVARAGGRWGAISRRSATTGWSGKARARSMPTRRRCSTGSSTRNG